MASPILVVLHCRGSDRDALDQNSLSPLVLAAKWGNAEAVKALLQGNVELNSTDKDGKTAVYWAAQEGHVSVLKVHALIPQ